MRKLIQPLRLGLQICFMAGLWFPLFPQAEPVGQFIWLSALITGVFFCGWICPFGAAQEWINVLSKRAHIPQLKIAPRYQKYLQVSRYLLFGLSTIGITFFFLNSRYYFEHNLIMGMMEATSITALITFLLSAVFIERPFCNYFCLKGAADGLMSIIRIFGISRNDKKCVNCHLCDKNCPMNIRVEKYRFVRHPNCINCMRCLTSCPKSCIAFKLLNPLKKS